VTQDGHLQVAADVEGRAEAPVGDLRPQTQAYSQEQAEHRAQEERLHQDGRDLQAVGRFGDILDLVAADRLGRGDSVVFSLLFAKYRHVAEFIFIASVDLLLKLVHLRGLRLIRDNVALNHLELLGNCCYLIFELAAVPVQLIVGWSAAIQDVFFDRLDLAVQSNHLGMAGPFIGGHFSSLVFQEAKHAVGVLAVRTHEPRALRLDSKPVHDGQTCGTRLTRVFDGFDLAFNGDLSQLQRVFGISIGGDAGAHTGEFFLADPDMLRPRFSSESQYEFFQFFVNTSQSLLQCTDISLQRFQLSLRRP
jgi:hypothetical protein